MGVHPLQSFSFRMHQEHGRPERRLSTSWASVVLESVSRQRLPGKAASCTGPGAAPDARIRPQEGPRCRRALGSTRQHQSENRSDPYNGCAYFPAKIKPGCELRRRGTWKSPVDTPTQCQLQPQGAGPSSVGGAWTGRRQALPGDWSGEDNRELALGPRGAKGDKVTSRAVGGGVSGRPTGRDRAGLCCRAEGDTKCCRWHDVLLVKTEAQEENKRALSSCAGFREYSPRRETAWVERSTWKGQNRGPGLVHVAASREAAARPASSHPRGTTPGKELYCNHSI